VTPWTLAGQQPADFFCCQIRRDRHTTGTPATGDRQSLSIAGG